MNSYYIKHIKNLDKLEKITDDQLVYYWYQVTQELENLKKMIWFSPKTKKYTLHPFVRLKIKSIEFYTPNLFKSLQIAYNADKEIRKMLLE